MANRQGTSDLPVHCRIKSRLEDTSFAINPHQIVTVSAFIGICDALSPSIFASNMPSFGTPASTLSFYCPQLTSISSSNTFTDYLVGRIRLADATSLAPSQAGGQAGGSRRMARTSNMDF
ncbi:hypothetical protein FRB94_002901 [Tulasnella sp. JGI-2019a]|nr:hypothetical protein FRB93_013921 [Tulasnella sp. JGI-2019a]KAG9013373.1 hypothetical protein FRB94_002901 [Tulasnella sp. JGI-2019a]